MAFFEKTKSQFEGTRDIWLLYWKVYGGWKALLGSTYFILAFILTLICFPLWTSGNKHTWFALSNSILPNLLGFTLGGYAILLAFGGRNFMRLIAGPDDDENGDPSPFMSINATFLHFIIIQVLGLIFSIIAIAWDIETGVLAFIGSFLFLYAITSSLAAAMTILKISYWYDDYVGKTRDDDCKD